MSKRPSTRLLKDPTKAAAFLAKAEKERVRLEKRLVRTLKDDIQRSLKNEILPDLQLICGKSSVSCHMSILNLRIPQLIARVRPTLTCSENGRQELRFEESSFSAMDVEQFVTMVYTADLLDEDLMRRFEEAFSLPISGASPQEKEDTDKQNETKCRQLQENTADEKKVFKTKNLTYNEGHVSQEIADKPQGRRALARMEDDVECQEINEKLLEGASKESEDLSIDQGHISQEIEDKPQERALTRPEDDKEGQEFIKKLQEVASKESEDLSIDDQVRDDKFQESSLAENKASVVDGSCCGTEDKAGKERHNCESASLRNKSCQNSSLKTDAKSDPEQMLGLRGESSKKDADCHSQSSATTDSLSVSDQFRTLRIETEDAQPLPAVENAWIQDQLEKMSGLQKDLMNMFLYALDTDIAVIVDGDKSVRAHRFVLSSRCSYFEAMLSGGWLESDIGEITLPGISYSSVVLILAFIYGALPLFPPTCNLCEISYFADMSGLEGLKDAVELSLVHHYCHFFHKPCHGCLSGVLESLLLSHQISSFPCVKDSCLSWITENLSRSWAQKSFATLPQDVVEECYQYAIDQLTIEMAINRLTEVDKLCHNLPSVKWTDPVRKTASRLLDTILCFVVEKFPQIAVERSFLKLFEGLGWSTDLLAMLFKKVVSTLTPQSTPSVFLTILRLEKLEDYIAWNGDAIAALSDLHSQCLDYMARNLSAVQHSSDWQKVPLTIQQQLKKNAVFVDDRRPQRARPVLSSSRRAKKTSVK